MARRPDWRCTVKLQGSTACSRSGRHDPSSCSACRHPQPRRRFIAFLCRARTLAERNNRPVSGLASLDASPSRKVRAHRPRVMPRCPSSGWRFLRNRRDASALTYRCGGSRGIAAVCRAPRSRFTQASAEARAPVANIRRKLSSTSRPDAGGTKRLQSSGFISAYPFACLAECRGDAQRQACFELVMGECFERDEAAHGTCGGSERCTDGMFDRQEAFRDVHLFSLCGDGQASRGDRLQDGRRAAGAS